MHTNGVLTYRDSTPEEEAAFAAEQAEVERYESTRKPTLEEKIDALMEYMGVKVRNMSRGVFEVVKDTPVSGDYIDPIPWVGQSVQTGLWYYTTDKDLPHEAIADGLPSDWEDRAYFDWIE